MPDIVVCTVSMQLVLLVQTLRLFAVLIRWSLLDIHTPTYRHTIIPLSPACWWVAEVVINSMVCSVVVGGPLGFVLLQLTVCF